MTSRPIGYRPLAGFDPYRIQPLLPGDSADFVHRWFGVLADRDRVPPGRREAWIDGRSRWLQDQLAERPQLRDLAANPLLLTFLAILAGDNAAEQLPQYRRQIYRAYEDRLFAAWENRRAGRRAALENLSLTTAVRGLHEIARFLHEAYYPAGGARYESRERPVREAVVNAVAQAFEGGAPGSRAMDDAEMVFEFWERSGMIRGSAPVNGEIWYLFAHQTFQEYGTARALARSFAGDLPALREFLDDRLTAEGWSEVIPLTLACLADRGTDVGALLSAWCRDPEAFDDDRPLVHAARSIAEGAAVGDEVLADVLLRLDTLAAADRRGNKYEAAVYQGIPNDEAVHLLIGIGWSHPARVRPTLTGMLTPDNPPGRRVRAAEAIGRLGDRPEACSALRRLAADQRMQVHWRLVAAWAMARLGSAKEALALIRGLLPGYTSPELGIGHSTLVQAVAEIRSPEAVRLLAEIGAAPRLESRDRISAALMLYRLGHQQRACQVLRLLRRDRSLPIRDQVVVKEHFDKFCGRGTP
ncbi:hypothetical protein AB0C07_32340 [Actinoplanes missouriensis]|uniref:NACHT domain-containing protein n=1 Tax=Actinoplanes missouriensis TaxID=1866 RepID=UPI0033CF9CF7